MNNNDLIWKIKDKKEVCKTPVLTVTEITSISPKDESGKYIVLDAPDWVVTVPVLEKEGKKYFVMVKQWRHGENALSIEFPGGVTNPGEDAKIGAARELQEETGYKSQKITFLHSTNPNSAIMGNKVHFYLAQDLQDTGKKDLDTDEFVETLLLPCDEVFEKMGTEEYQHSLMCCALFFYLQHLQKSK